MSARTQSIRTTADRWEKRGMHRQAARAREIADGIDAHHDAKLRSSKASSSRALATEVQATEPSFKIDRFHEMWEEYMTQIEESDGVTEGIAGFTAHGRAERDRFGLFPQFTVTYKDGGAVPPAPAVEVPW